MNKGFTKAQTVQCKYPYIHLTFHEYPTEGKGIPCSIHPLIQNWSKKMQLHKWCCHIRIFIKWLKNPHSLATHICEKEPQTLMDAISEVEKLNAAQQFTAIIIPLSKVNVVSNNEDCCFQCQESGHITWHCAHIWYYECNAYGHIVMDCPYRIPPSGTPATHHKSHKGHHTRSSSRHHHEDRDKANPDHSPILAAITAQIIVIHIEAALECTKGIDTATTGAVHNDLTQPIEDTATDLTVTHCTDHIADHPNIEAFQVINPEITVGHIQEHPTDPQGMNQADQVHTPAGQEESHILRRMWKWRLKTLTLNITAPMITPLIQEKNQIL